MTQTVYLVSIHGTGRGFHEAMEALETTPHLTISAGYLVAGEHGKLFQQQRPSKAQAITKLDNRIGCRKFPPYS